jgi:PAS domain S-box-containing protein
MIHIEWVLAASIVLQVLAAVQALRLVPVTAKRGAWVLISLAVLLMALRRAITLVMGLADDQTSPAELWAEWVALITSGLLLVGITWIAPLFQSMRNTMEALRESDERHRSFFENSMDGVVLASPDGCYLAANPAACEISDMSEAEMCRLGREGLIDTADPRWSKAMEERARTGKFRGELTAIRKDGSRYPIEVSSAAFHDRDAQLRTVNIFRDITERKQAEQALQRAHNELERRVQERTAELTQANERLQREIEVRQLAEAGRMLLAKATEQAGEGVVITNARGVVLYVNPAFERISGYGWRELVGQSVTLIESGRHDPAFYRNVWVTLEEGRVWNGRFTNRRKDGRLFEVEATIAPIRDHTGEVAHHVAVERDVTEQLKLEKQLREAQKMEAVGTLARGIAHDFNNLLGTIIGQTELAQDDLAPGLRARSNLDVVLEASYQARDLVNQILTFSRRNGQELMPTLIAPVMVDCLELFCKSLPDNIELCIKIEPPADAARIGLADATQMQQVLMNLCNNAADAMLEAGGILEISLVCVDLPGAAPVSPPSLPAGPYLCLTVKDMGPGLDPAEEGVLDRIFEPYFTTKAHGKGSGLGLAVVYGIVSSLGGAITVDTDPGAGTSFHVFLPRCEVKGGS